MPRTFLTIVLMLATLLGPCMCCCTFASIVAPPPVAIQSVATAPPVPDEYTCPFCRKALQPPTPAPTLPLPATPARDQCPCCQERATASSIAEVPTVFVLDHVLVALLPIDTATTLAKTAPPIVREYPPGLSVRDFLVDYCHRLRC